MFRGVHDDGLIQLLHIIIKNLFAAVLVKNELVISQIDNVTVFKPVGDNQFFVDEGSIFALQVNQNKPVPDRIYFGMMP